MRGCGLFGFSGMADGAFVTIRRGDVVFGFFMNEFRVSVGFDF